jgi:hypothetical protein
MQSFACPPDGQGPPAFWPNRATGSSTSAVRSVHRVPTQNCADSELPHRAATRRSTPYSLANRQRPGRRTRRTRSCLARPRPGSSRSASGAGIRERCTTPAETGSALATQVAGLTYPGDGRVIGLVMENRSPAPRAGAADVRTRDHAGRVTNGLSSFLDVTGGRAPLSLISESGLPGFALLSGVCGVCESRISSPLTSNRSLEAARLSASHSKDTYPTFLDAPADGKLAVTR